MKYLGSLSYSQTVERVLEFAIQINKSEQILKKQSKHSKFKSSQENLAVQITKRVASNRVITVCTKFLIKLGRKYLGYSKEGLDR